MKPLPHLHGLFFGTVAEPATGYEVSNNERRRIKSLAKIITGYKSWATSVVHFSPYSNSRSVWVGKEIVGGGKPHNGVVGVTRASCHLIPMYVSTIIQKILAYYCRFVYTYIIMLSVSVMQAGVTCIHFSNYTA